MWAKIQYGIRPKDRECAELDEADFSNIARSLNAAFLSYYAFFAPISGRKGEEMEGISTENQSIIRCKMRRDSNGCCLEMEINEGGIYAKTQGKWITNTAKPYYEYETESRKEAIEQHLRVLEDGLKDAYLLKRIV